MGIGIQLETCPIVTGSTIKGSVFISFGKDVKAKQLVVQLKGEEYSKVQYTKQVRKTGFEDRGVSEFESVQCQSYSSSNLIFLDIPVDVGQMIQMGKVQSGNYVLPFEVELPSYLPSSLSFESNGSTCDITYTLKAQLKGSGWFSDYKCKKQLDVSSCFDNMSETPYNGSPTMENVNFCCCINKGHMLLGARVSNTNRCIGENITVSASCRNHSTAEINDIKLVLTETVKLTSDSHATSVTTTLYEIPVNMGAAFSQESAESEGSAEFEAMAQELQEGTYEGQFSIPGNAMNTYSGNLIQVSHSLVVVAQTNGCMTDPSLNIPLRLCDERKNATPEQAPQVEEPPFDVSTANTAPLVFVPSADAVIGTGGGPAVFVPSSSMLSDGGKAPDEENDVFVPLTNIVHEPTFQNLLKEMGHSVDDLNIIKNKTQDSNWDKIFNDITPLQLGQILKEVDMAHDQTPVAKLVAEKSAYFICEHVVKAIRNCVDWNTVAMVETLLPFTKDVALNKNSILDKLSEWDKTLTAVAFRNAS